MGKKMHYRFLNFFVSFTILFPLCCIRTCNYTGEMDNNEMPPGLKPPGLLTRELAEEFNKITREIIEKEKKSAQTPTAEQKQEEKTGQTQK